MISPFPIVIKSGLVAPTITALFGVSMLFFGLWDGLNLLSQLPEVSLSQLIPRVSGSLFSIGIGIFLLHRLLWKYPRKTVFTDDQMIQQFLTHTVTQPMEGLVGIRLGYELRAVRRSSPRRLYSITFIYAHDEQFKWIPHEFNFPIAYLDRIAARQATELVTQLRCAYLPIGLM